MNELHLIDLHLREDAACGRCWNRICVRPIGPDNPNQAVAKTKHPWRFEDGIVSGGLVKRVSTAMIHTDFHYITSGLPARDNTSRNAAGPVTGWSRGAGRGASHVGSCR